MLGSGYKDKQDKVPFGVVRKSDDEKDIFKVMNEFEKKDSFIGLVWGKIPNKLRAKIKKIVRN